LFNWSVFDGRLDKNPIRGLHLPQGDPRRAVSEAEFQTMLRGSSAVFRRYLIFLRFTGCRPGEAAGLRWPWIDWNLGAAFIPAAHHKAGHKTHKPRLIVLPLPILKLLRWLQARQHQAVPSIEVVKGWLRERLRNGPVKAVEIRDGAHALRASEAWLRRARRELGVRCERIGFGRGGHTYYALADGIEPRPRAQGKCREPADDHVFLNARSEPWTRVGIAHRLKEIRRRTGLSKEATPHGLRHLFATAGVARGGSVKLLSAVLGHASTSITEKFYVNLDNGHIEALRAIATAAGQRTRKAQ
jgi:integrase